MHIFVGNIVKDTSENKIREIFKSYGEVNSVEIIEEEEESIHKKIGFIEMPLNNEAEYAIQKLDKSNIDGQIIQVNMARIGAIDRRKKDRKGGRRSYDPSERDKFYYIRDFGK